MENQTPIVFADNVRIRTTDLTSDLKLAGLVGHVYGQTTPSETNVEVVGEVKTDYAVNVYFDELKQAFWFAEDLLEFVDHGPGLEMTLEGIPKKWTRTASGEWAVREIEITHSSTKPWWKFW